jgi:hypothetical protein
MESRERRRRVGAGRLHSVRNGHRRVRHGGAASPTRRPGRLSACHRHADQSTIFFRSHYASFGNRKRKLASEASNTIDLTQFVNKHRSGTPGYLRANPWIQFVNLAENRGPDRRRSGPHPERISSCYIKALQSSELGARFGAYSHGPSFAFGLTNDLSMPSSLITR